MTVEAQLAHTERLFAELLPLPAAERAVRLDDIARTAPELHERLVALLRAAEAPDNPLDTPPGPRLAEIICRDVDGPSVGQVIAHYRLESLLGRGGMGEVWLATDTRLGRRVALKLLPAALSVDRTMVSRFEREAKAASALNHPSILTVHEIGEAGGVRYIAAEFIEGETLREMLRRGRLPLDDTARITSQILAAVATAHRAGIVHRDLKPENVMLRPDGLVKVLDFGLAKYAPSTVRDNDALGRDGQSLTTNTGAVMGTARYMSPEQARGEPLDARSDVFSLGVMLYEMLSGDAPFAGPTPVAVLSQVLTHEPQPLHDTPTLLSAIVQRALQKDRTDRFASATEFAADLEEVRRSGALDSTPSSPAVPIPQESATTVGVSRTTRWRRWAGGGARVAAAVVAVAAVGWAGVKSYDWIRRPAIDTVAVLPFANLDAIPELDYLSVGLSRSVLDNLSRMHGLFVTAHAATTRFDSRTFDPAAVSAALGVRAIVSGSVTERNSRLQVSAELMDVATKRRLWGDSYDRPADDLVAVQTDISRHVATALSVWLTRAVDTHLTRQQAIAPAAYRRFLQAQSSSGLGPVEGQKRSIALLNEALALEPQYAEAWGMLSGAYASLAYTLRASTGPKSPEDFGSTLAFVDDYQKKAAAAAEKARAFDPEPAGVSDLRAKAAREAEAWHWSNAVYTLRYATRLAPTNADLLDGLSEILSAQGQHDEAVATAKRAYELEPLSSSRANLYGQALMFARRYDEAIAFLTAKKTTDDRSVMTHIFLAECFKHTRRFAEADAEFDAVEKAGAGGIKNSFNYGLFAAVAGRRGEAERVLQQALASGDEDGSGVLYAALGDRDRALAALEQEVLRRTPNIPILNAMPELDWLRVEPRFQAILVAAGLPVPAP